MRWKYNRPIEKAIEEIEEELNEEESWKQANLVYTGIVFMLFIEILLILGGLT